MVIKFLLSILLLWGCSSNHHKFWQDYRALVELGQYDKAEKLLDESEIAKDPKNQLLLLMEKGLLKFHLKEYTDSQRLLVEAIELVDAQYTKSLTEKVATYIVNDNKETYYGSIYEQSWLHFYAALASYNLYLQDPVKNREQLFRARALMLNWDSFFQYLDRSSNKKTLYKHDLVAKIFAAQIHESIATRSDLQISIQLYKDAQQLLGNWSGVYRFLNKSAEEHYEGLKNAIDKNESPKNLKIHKTTSYENLNRYLTLKIESLTKNKPSRSVVIFLENGLIPEKKARKISLGLRGALANIKDEKTRRGVEDIGAAIITHFAMETLNLTPRPGTYRPGEFSASYNLVNVGAREAAIEFDVPSIDYNYQEHPPYQVVVKNDLSGAITEHPLTVIADIGDLSRMTLSEEANARIWRTGIRVATKYFVAILSSYSVYKSLKNGDSNFLASTAAIGTFLAATKAIAATERADIRSWKTLPLNLSFVEFDLSPGSYSLSIKKETISEQNSTTPCSLGTFQVTPSIRNIFAYRIY